MLRDSLKRTPSVASARPRAGRRPPPPRTTGGWTMIEMMLAITLLSIGLLAASRAILQTSTVTETLRETSLATAEGRRVIETLQATPLTDVFRMFNADPLDDPGGAGTAPGAAWAVDGLDPLPDDADGLVGEIVLPTQGGAIREDVVDSQLGTPRDLNGDGLIDAADHSLDCRILPVRVRLRWRGQTGPGSLEFRTILGSF